jgi:peptide/nickel transport system ATP-binding protein
MTAPAAPPPGAPGAPVVLAADGLVKDFRAPGGPGRRRGVLHAVRGVSLELAAGEIVALVGESGSGKSTLARLLSGLERPTGGQILLRGRPVQVARGRDYRAYKRSVQMIFQDPFSSLNPAHTVRYHLSRPVSIHQAPGSRAAMDAALAGLLQQVHLTPAADFLAKYPHELSGGQRQRVAIARALAARPQVLLADEPVSMLDVSLRLGVLNLLAELCAAQRLGILYITHDIASARYFAGTILVMQAGSVVEAGPAEQVTQSPAHPYTRQLIASAPDPDRALAGSDGGTSDGGTTAGGISNGGTSVWGNRPSPPPALGATR